MIENTKSLWRTAQPGDAEETGRPDSIPRALAFALQTQLLYFSWCCRPWSEFIEDVKEQVVELTTKFPYGLDPKFNWIDPLKWNFSMRGRKVALLTDFGDGYKTRRMLAAIQENKIVISILTIRRTIEVLKNVSYEYGKILDQFEDNLKEATGIPKFQREVTAKIRELEARKDQVETLGRVIGESIRLVSGNYHPLL